jgi:hypothetical protein
MPDPETIALRKVCHEIVFKVACCSFRGQLPDDPVIVVRSIVSILPDMPEEKLKEILPHLYHAVIDYQDMQQNRFPL